jgi:hypothetical protein
MLFKYMLGGGAPVVKKYQVGSGNAQVGQALVQCAAGGYGVALATTTAAAGFIGCAEDDVTAVTAQQTGNADPERRVSVVVNPDAVWEATLAGGATSGTALTLYTETVASTTGLLITAGSTDFTNFDEGAIVCYEGANAGIVRKIITGNSSGAVPGVAFPNDTVVGDTFMVAPFFPPSAQFVQLTSDFKNVNASVAVDTDNNNFVPIELFLRGVADAGRTNSKVHLVAFDHLFASS